MTSLYISASALLVNVRKRHQRLRVYFANDDSNADATGKRPGPKPERLKIDREDWEQAVREGLEAERPVEGWPDEVEGEEEGKNHD